MKQTVSLLLASILVVLLVGCGSVGTKRELAKSQFTQLDESSQQANAAVTRINKTVAESNNMVSASFGDYATQLAAVRDSYDTEMKSLKKLDEEELDAFLARLDAAVLEGKLMASQLDEAANEIDKLSAGAKKLLEDLNAIISAVNNGTLTAEQQQTYAEIATGYQNLKGQLAGIFAQVEGEGLEANVQALRLANEAVSPLCSSAASLKSAMAA